MKDWQQKRAKSTTVQNRNFRTEIQTSGREFKLPDGNSNFRTEIQTSGRKFKFIGKVLLEVFSVFVLSP
jgi:hypothetical protein